MILPILRFTVQYIHVPLNAHWQALARASVAMIVLLISTFVLMQPDCLLATVVHNSGFLGIPAIWTLATLAALACLDVIINDMLPPRFTLSWVLPHRHLLFLAMALLLTALAAVLAYFGIRPAGTWVVIAAYALLAAAVAYLDLFSRPRG